MAPFLNTGVIHAVLQTSGITECSYDRWNSSVNIGAGRQLNRHIRQDSAVYLVWPRLLTGESLSLGSENTWPLSLSGATVSRQMSEERLTVIVVKSILQHGIDITQLGLE